MGAINNLECVAPFIAEKFDGDTFHYTELLDRTKKSGNNKGRRIRTFYHRTRQDLYEQMPSIIELCDYTGARAYTRLAARSFKKVGQAFAKIVLEQAFSENWEGMRHGYSKACGTTRVNKVWLFDVDYLEDDEETVELMARPEFLGVIPSRKGRHIITSPFDIRLVKSWTGRSECHRDNPVNLYIPEGS